jgi:hypothetical protein
MTKPITTILTGVALLLTGYFCPAATTNAPTGSFFDVSNLVAQASPGDTVVMPPGTNVWPQTLWLPTGISLLGSGTNFSGTNTTIICGLDGGGAGNICALACKALSSNNPTRISNFILQGTNTANYNDWGCIWMNVTGGGPDGSVVPWCIDHVIFNQIPMQNIKAYNIHSGLIADCIFNITAQIPGQVLRLVDSDHQSGGSYSWSVPYAYGGKNALYVEHCFFTNAVDTLCGLNDCNGGGSLVFRYNTCYNVQYNNHGTESSGMVRSQRSFEIYGNTFVGTVPSTVYSTALLIRGGTGVIISNTFAGWEYACTLDNYRSGEYFPPFNGAYGANPWDSNDPTNYFSGIWTNGYCQASNNVITFTGVNWTSNQWVGYTVWNTTAHLFDTSYLGGGAPEYTFAVIWSNTTNTLTLQPSKDGSPAYTAPFLTFYDGDTYQFSRVIRTLDQTGLGSGDLITYNGIVPWDSTANTNSAPLANEVSEPLYWWGNTLNGAIVNLDNHGYFNLVENRDFYNGIAKPDYVPLADPYPQPDSTNSLAVGPTNSSPNPNNSDTAATAPTTSSSNTVAITSALVVTNIATATNGLVAWYPLARDANDYSGNGNNGTLVGNPGFATGPNGSTNAALALNGSGQCVTIPSAPAIVLTSNLTITAWVYLNVFGIRNELVTKGVSGNSDGFPAPFELYQGNDLNPGNIGLAVGNGGGSYDKIVSGNLLTNTWFFVTATLAGNVASLYTNGVLSASATVSATLVDGGGNLMIGNNNQNWYSMNGDIAQVRLFNRALSPAEIVGLYSNGLASLASTNAVNPPTNPAPSRPPPISPPSKLSAFPH